MIIPIPKNPLTLLINGALVETQIKALVDSYLPNFEILYTSKYRNEEQNKKAGGAENSAHLYNLARDFVLINKSTGNTATDTEMKKVYEGFIKPFWEGWSSFNPKQPHTSTGWIHVNLERDITNYVKWIAYAGTAAGVALGIKELFNYVKTKMKGR